MFHVGERNIKVNSVLNVIKTVSGILFPLITFPYVSRILQPENMGKVNFGSSFVSYFTLIATLGITTYAIRECSAVRTDREKLGAIASEIFSINVCTTIAAYVLLAVSLIFFRRLDSYRTLIVIQSTAILFTTLGADWLNTAMEDFVYITARTIAFQMISLILMFVFVKTPDDYMKYAGISVLSSSGANLLNVFYRKRYCQVRFTSRMKWNVHFKPILLLFVMILAQNIFSSADVTMLGLMKGDFEVGIYSTAVKVENIIAQVVFSLAWVVMPRMAAYFAEGNYVKINQMLKKVMGVFFLIGLPSIAGVLSLSREIVLIVGGEKYSGAAVPLRILMLAFFFSLFGGSFLGNMVLLPSKNEKTFMSICSITAVINVVLNYILIPFWGVSGAAVTTAFSSLLILLLLLKCKDKRIKLTYIKEVGFIPLTGSILVFAYCYLVGMIVDNIWLKTGICIIGGVVLYVAAMVIMKNDLCIELLMSIRDKLKRHN